MKKLFLLFTLFLSLQSFAQTRQDTIEWLQKSASLYDLDFTAAEADSMISNIFSWKRNYTRMHQRYPKNDLAYPFAFQPAPFGFVIPVKQQKINWNIPSNVTLPKNKNDLAYYSILQLASLVKNKKISSVALTQFFLNRLKNFGDTLQSVITLTEDLAMQQARQADSEIAAGKYRGPLHGIPYGLKDLFAVKGYKTTWGSTPYMDQVVDEDAYVYTKLKEAGAVLCAKLSLGALAYNNKWFGGETKNPWNLEQGSSGSSAGSAASVVAGLLPFTIGTETLG
ncbi:MAG: amidase family protein, partial [Flavisolibacter sp.]